MKYKEYIRPFWKYTFILLIVLIGVIITLNSFMRHHFYNQSIQFIILIQKHKNWYLDAFMNIVSLLANTQCIILLLVVLYVVVKRKMAVFVYITYFLINAYLANILKLSYR